MPSWLQALLTFLGLLVVFPAFWLGITRLITTTAGWPRLVAEFPAPRGFREEPYFGMTSGRIGLARFNGVLRVSSGPSGLYVSILPLFAWGAPPILVPWDRVEWRGERWGWVRLRLLSRKPVDLTLAKRVWDARQGAPDGGRGEAGSGLDFDLPTGGRP
jgi:hypothetical protein